MRGKHAVFLYLLTSPRITPAHAGKTFPNGLDARLDEDHPRACGENIRTDKEA